MTEKEKWDRGVAALCAEFSGFSQGQRNTASRLATAIITCKSNLHLIIKKAGAEAICTDCQGECCRGGKNHVGAVDLLVYLCEGIDLFEPYFEQEFCPYLSDCGCMMAPEFRPYNCITFVCEQVDDLVPPGEKARLLDLERELRYLYQEMESLLDKRFRYSLLGVCERSTCSTANG